VSTKSRQHLYGVAADEDFGERSGVDVVARRAIALNKTKLTPKEEHCTVCRGTA
jgi:hypothetical protein